MEMIEAITMIANAKSLSLRGLSFFLFGSL